jgi:NADPH-dependent curcumin reductase CurA
MLMRGFIVSQYQHQFPEGVAQLSKWLEEGKLKSSETVVEGFEKLPEAFIGLFLGKNIGKMIVKTN